MKVEYLDHMGTDLSVVNAARVSFGKKSKWETVPKPVVSVPHRRLSEKDTRLIEFLARGCSSEDWEETLLDFTFWGPDDLEELEEIVNYVRRMPPHWTPFGHCTVSLHFKVPFFIAAQIKKHQVGFVVNEVSRRYVDSEPEFYVPETWRLRAKNIKQGSRDEGFAESDVRWAQEIERAVEVYNDLIAEGVCPEQARMALPLATYTEFWMTGSLYGWANFYNQRSDSHAQREIQEVAQQVQGIVEKLYPVSWKALTR